MKYMMLLYTVESEVPENAPELYQDWVTLLQELKAAGVLLDNNGLAPVANAVFDAVGVRVDEIPVTPEKILKALAAKAAGKDARFGPSSFPLIPWPETLMVTPPWEGGDGRASNDPKRKKRVAEAGMETRVLIPVIKEQNLKSSDLNSYWMVRKQWRDMVVRIRK